MSLSYNFDPTAIYLAADLHETRDALLAYIEMDYNVKDKMIAAINKERRHIKSPSKSEEEDWKSMKEEYQEITKKANHQSGFTRRAKQP